MRRAWLLAVLLCAPPAPASASGNWVPHDETHLPIGLNVGYAAGDPPSGALLGGEISLVRWHDGFWYGVYGDYLQAFGPGGGRLSVGGEAGVFFLGVDGGYVRDLSVDANGWRVRGLLSALLITGYGGGGGLSVGRGEASFWEVGVLLKVPLFSRSDGREDWGWGPYFE
jgi:hypothetical protein